jgi:hypothetical protein
VADRSARAGREDADYRVPGCGDAFVHEQIGLRGTLLDRSRNVTIEYRWAEGHAGKVALSAWVGSITRLCCARALIGDTAVTLPTTNMNGADLDSSF